MMGILALLGFSGGSIWRALRTYRHDLWNIRRPNVFDDEHTVPLSTGILLAVNTIVFGGIVLYTLAGEPTYDGFGPIGISIGIMAAYYIFRLTAYEVVGYTFGTPEGRRRWLDGFLRPKPSQASYSYFRLFCSFYSRDGIARSLFSH